MKFLGKGRKNFKSLWKSDSEANNSRSFKKAPQTIKQNKSLGGKMFWIRLGFKKGQEVLISDVTLLQEDKKCYWSGVSVIQLWWRSNRDPVVDFDPTIVGQGFNSTARFQLKWSKLLCLNWSGSGWYEKERQKWLSCIGLALDTGRVITTTGRNFLSWYGLAIPYWSEICSSSEYESSVKMLFTRNIPHELREKLNVSSDFHQSLIVPILQPPTTILESCDHKWPSNTIVPTG